jgi:hypothetical protein
VPRERSDGFASTARDLLRVAWVALSAAFPVGLAIVIGVASVMAANKRFELPGKTLGEQVTGILAFVVVSGLCSMAMIETAKRLFRLRGWYQHHQVRLWLENRSSDEEAFGMAYSQLLTAIGSAPAFGRSSRYNRSILWHVIYGLVSYRRYIAQVFDLPIEQLAAQIRMAADLAIVDPDRNFALLASIAALDDETSGVVRESGLYRMREAVNVETESTEELRIAHLVRAGVDALQISVGEGWRRYIQAWAVSISGLVGFYLARYAGLEPEVASVYVLASLVLGGFFAWFARDLTAVVERWRR